MKNIEDAYMAIAGALTNSAEARWDSIKFDTKILNKNCSSMTTISQCMNVEAYIDTNFNSVFLINDACIYLRDNILATTGQRIWGLTFMLYPDGKFNIEYDYNKPADYEETDNLITGEEINQSLTNLNNKK